LPITIERLLGRTLLYEKVTQYGQGFGMLGITRQDFID
jgi:hypothetical protein